VGLNKDDPCLIQESLLHPDIFVYDLIYNPKETLLLRMAQEAGAQTSNGLGMLYYQGVLALQHWAGVELEQEVKTTMRRALEEAAGK
jgi:shikimate dehydrogenase